jgi:serine/threonine protein kinase
MSPAPRLRSSAVPGSSRSATRSIEDPSSREETSPVDSPAFAIAPELPAQVREGRVLAGRYRIGNVLGTGAMGTVVAAHHLLLDERVAIKFLSPAALRSEDAVARFLGEARAAVRIQSPHVVRVFDVATLDGGAPYIVMECLDGCDLGEWLKLRGPLPVEWAVDFILQACHALADAHSRGVIHRDVKPANLFAVHRGGVVHCIKVLDFGISKAAEAASTPDRAGARSRRASSGRQPAIGSPCYMSPEQMEGAPDVDARADIWALGVTLCELLTGELPFVGDSLNHVYSTIQSGARPRLRGMAPHVPPGLEAVLARCLQTDRARRHSAVAELAGALAPFGSWRAWIHALGAARDGEICARPSSTPRPVGKAAPPSGRAPAAMTQTLPSAPPVATRASPRRPLAALAWAVLSAAVASVVTAAVVPHGAPSRPRENPPAPTAVSWRHERLLDRR